MTLQGSGYCIACGAQLETGHRFCWRCGAPRWTPGADPAPTEARPPGTRTPPAPPTPGRAVAQAAGLGALPWFYAAGAVFFLIWATQELAVFLAPTGRSEVMAQLARQGLPASQQPALLVAEAVMILGAALVAAALHAAAFYGLRRGRRWGWLAAVIIAGGWSLLLVGVPVLLRLVARKVRQAYGVD